MWRIGVRVGVLAALPAAIMAEVLLFAIGSLTVLDDVFTVAVVTGNDLSNHCWILSFDLDPLPVVFDTLQAGMLSNWIGSERRAGQSLLPGVHCDFFLVPLSTFYTEEDAFLTEYLC